MDVFEAVRTVLAVRAYGDRAVPGAIRARIVEAGRLTASAMNGQPWHFVVIEQRDSLQEVGRLMRTGRYIADASFAIVVLIEKGKPLAVSDASRAIQSMVLSAWADGVGSNWVGFGPLPAVEKLIGAPETYQALAVIAFGYPAERLGRGNKARKPLGEVASRERFGAPFA